MSNFKIVRFKNLDFVQFQKYIHKHWKKNHIFSKEKKIFNFQYKDGRSYNFFLALVKKRLIGMQGFIDYKIYDKNLKQNQIFLAFWSVIDNSNIGIGLKLHKEIINFSKPLFIGVVEVSNATHKAHKWLGFKVKKMHHHALFSKQILNFKIAKVDKKKLNFKKLKRKTSFIRLDKKNIFQFVEDSFYNIQIPTKSSEFLIKRYLKHPVYDYRIYGTLYREKIIAIFVIRPVFLDNSCVLRLVDFIGDNNNFDSIENLGNVLLDEFKAEYLDIYSYGIPKKIFKKTNFIDCQNKLNFIVPNRFEPFLKKNFDIYCAYKTNLKKNNIKIFKADGDGDRPSIIK